MSAVGRGPARLNGGVRARHGWGILDADYITRLGQARLHDSPHPARGT